MQEFGDNYLGLNFINMKERESYPFLTPVMHLTSEQTTLSHPQPRSDFSKGPKLVVMR